MIMPAALCLKQRALQVQLAPPCALVTTSSTPWSLLLFASGDAGGMYGLTLSGWVMPKLWANFCQH